MPNRNQLSDFMKNLAFKILNGEIEIFSVASSQYKNVTRNFLLKET